MAQIYAFRYAYDAAGNRVAEDNNGTMVCVALCGEVFLSQDVADAGPRAEAANTVCIWRKRWPKRHVSRLYERIARRKAHTPRPWVR